MNAILGGLFSSRINLNLRRRTRTRMVLLVIRLATRRWPVHRRDRGAQRRHGRGGARDPDRDRPLRDAGVTDAELTLATSYLDGVFPIRFESTRRSNGLQPSWYRTGCLTTILRYRPTRFESITAASCAVGCGPDGSCDPEQLQIVAVGDPNAYPRSARNARRWTGPDAYDVEGTAAP